MKIVSLPRIDPDLIAGLPAGDREAAAASCTARTLEIRRGEWDAEEIRALHQDPAGFGLLVVSGILCRHVVQGRRCGAELVGPGDLMRPWDLVGEWSTIPTEPAWTVLVPARVAILDAAFARRSAPFPAIAEALTRRALLRSRYLAILIAIVGHRRIETRLTMLFWHLADRFGRMGGEWVEVPVPLTHALLAELVAARRPTVSTALSKLAEDGILLSHDDGWRLSAAAAPERQAMRIAAERR
jgi:CRP-like cAMP-binding protein